MTPRQDMTTEPDPQPDPPPGPVDLERAILGETPEFNAKEVAAATGVTLEEARRLWRALGFPEFSGEKAFLFVLKRKKD